MLFAELYENLVKNSPKEITAVQREALVNLAKDEVSPVLIKLFYVANKIQNFASEEETAQIVIGLLRESKDEALVSILNSCDEILESVMNNHYG